MEAKPSRRKTPSPVVRPLFSAILGTAYAVAVQVEFIPDNDAAPTDGLHVSPVPGAPFLIRFEQRRPIRPVKMESVAAVSGHDLVPFRNPQLVALLVGRSLMHAEKSQT